MVTKTQGIQVAGSEGSRPPGATSVFVDCIRWDIARIDEIRATQKLNDQENAQLVL